MFNIATISNSNYRHFGNEERERWGLCISTHNTTQTNHLRRILYLFAHWVGDPAGGGVVLEGGRDHLKERRG